MFGCTAVVDPSTNSTSADSTALTLGTRFIYYGETYDQNSTLASTDTTTATVVALSDTAWGRTGVVTLVDVRKSNPSDRDSTYVIGEANGDLWMLRTQIASAWVKIAFSDSAEVQTLLTSSIHPQTKDTIETYLVTEVRGHDTFTLAGRSYVALKGGAILRVITKRGGVEIKRADLMDGEVWWSPKLHAIVKSVSAASFLSKETTTEYLIRIERP